ncbi:synaptogenesis protein syg-1 [Anabrus simplex]|uniref:synaptogenesis protein syg-1 n=1 Tax=Anabrus simplex TaxID=316456 RepID=UPI0035A324D1
MTSRASYVRALESPLPFITEAAHGLGRSAGLWYYLWRKTIGRRYLYKYYLARKTMGRRYLYKYYLAMSGIQKFEKQPEYTEVNPREDAVLTCKVYNKRGTCSWQKDNKPVGIYANKYEWAGDQSKGDCSLWVRAATLEFDDGEWECQVTASDFTTQDALTSAPVRLVVRVAPLSPRVEYNSSQVLPGHNLTVPVGEKATIRCISRLGNPPAKIKWFIGDDEVADGHSQSNATEMDNPRTWVAVSVLKLTVNKNMFGKTLKCVAAHESYHAKALQIEVRLDVRYSPEVRMHGAPSKDLEDGKDDIILRCVADANPPATIMWRRTGQSDIVSVDETLRFRPITRRDSGNYTCQGKNDVGSSKPLSVQLDVKFPPKILDVGADRLKTAVLFTSVTFICNAEGNPLPSYRWIQKLLNSEDTIHIRGSESRLHIANVTYDYQGEYVCTASNIIGGMKRLVQSQPISLQVVGAPQVLPQSSGREVEVSRGQDALLRLVVCADPRPRRTAWEWSGQRLEAGGDLLGRYLAEELAQDEREDCYEAKLHVRQVNPEDSRNYYLVVENERGADKYAIYLAVTEPIPIATLLSLVTGSFILIVVLVLATIYASRREKCCFGRYSAKHIGTRHSAMSAASLPSNVWTVNSE